MAWRGCAHLMTSANFTQPSFHREKFTVFLSLSGYTKAGKFDDIQRLQCTLKQALSNGDRAMPRCCDLLLCLPALRSVSLKAVSFFNEIRQTGNIIMQKLFHEMLDHQL